MNRHNQVFQTCDKSKWWTLILLEIIIVSATKNYTIGNATDINVMDEPDHRRAKPKKHNWKKRLGKASHCKYNFRHDFI